MLACAETQIVECGDGVRLLGHYSSQVAAGRPPARDLAILLHGWEGSADSMYVLSLGSYLFELGCDVFRLNFRDHGPSHHLNEEIFHSCRLDEVVGAVRAIQRAIPQPRVTIAGFSLGGNFALRVAARAPAAGITLERAIAICPVLRPHSTMDVLEAGPFIYHRYFIAKWKESLRLKQRLFPKRYDFAPILAQRSIKEMTRIMVEQIQRVSEPRRLPERLRDHRRPPGAARGAEPHPAVARRSDHSCARSAGRGALAAAADCSDPARRPLRVHGELRERELG